MKRLLSIAAILLALAPAALAQPLTFTAVPAAVGQIEVLTSRMEFSGKMEMKSDNGFQASMPIVNRQREEVEKEILAVADGAAVRRRLTYRVAEQTEGIDGTKFKSKPTAGKTYTLDLAGGKVTVRDAQGALATAEEEQELKSEIKSLGEREKFCDALAGRSWKVGDAVDPHNPGVLRALDMDSADVDSFSMVLKEVTRGEGAPLARFDVEMRLHSRDKDSPELTFTFRGKLLVDPATCRPVSLEAEGPLEIAASQETEGQKLEMKGSAAAQLSFRAEYRQARPAP